MALIIGQSLVGDDQESGTIPMPQVQNIKKPSSRYQQGFRPPQTEESTGLRERCDSTSGERTVEHLRLGFECQWRVGDPEGRVVDSDEGDAPPSCRICIQLTRYRMHIILSLVPILLNSCHLISFTTGSLVLEKQYSCTTSESFMRLAEERLICLMHGKLFAPGSRLKLVTPCNVGFGKSPPLAMILFESLEGVFLQ